MRTKILSPSDEPSMLDLFRSDKNSISDEYYLDRGNSFWGIYNWFSNKGYVNIGVFENEQLIGMATLVKLPFRFRKSDLDIFLLTDFFVHSHYRRSFATMRLLSELNRCRPGKNFFEFAVENQAGLIDPGFRFTKKKGNSVIVPRTTVLTTLYLNQNLKTESRTAPLVITQDWAQINSHLRKFEKESNTWTQWLAPVQMEGVFRSVWMFQYRSVDIEISGLIIDRGNLQRICWNGQSRAQIEKYRRSLKAKGKNFNPNDELPFLSVGFILPSANTTWPADLVKSLARFSFEHDYFCLNLRDIPLDIPTEIDQVRFPRQVVLACDCSDEELIKVVEENKDRAIIMEPIYL